MQISRLIFIIFSLVCGTTHSLTCPGEGWEYAGNKCLKIIMTPMSKEDAALSCSNEPTYPLDVSTPQLLELISPQEQAALESFLQQIPFAPGIWLGAHRVLGSDSTFIWTSSNKSIDEFSNWAPDAPSDSETRPCVEIQSDASRAGGNLGFWKDVSCHKGNWVMCEKLPPMTLDEIVVAIRALQAQDVKLKEHITSLNADIITLNQQLSNTGNDVTTINSTLITMKRNPVPVNYIYTQLPGQKTPTEIWPDNTWTDISNDSNLVGRFFRVVGGGSAAFGTAQADASPRITSMGHTHYDYTFTPGNVSIGYPDTSGYLRTGSGGHDTSWNIRFTTTGGEVRPVNTAIRIWKRTA